MAKNMELGIIMTAAVGGALTGLARTGKAMSDLGDKYKKLSQVMHNNKTKQDEIRRMEQLTKAYVSVGKEWIAAVTKLRKLKEAHEKNGQSNEKLAQKIKQQEKAVQNLATKKTEAEKAYRRAKIAIDSEHGSLKAYRETVEKTTKSIEKQQKLRRIDENYKRRNENLDNLSKYGDQAAKVSAVTGAMAVAPLKIYMDVEESQADLRKMLGNEAQKYYAELRKISDNSPLSQPQVFEIAGSLAQSGIAGNDLVEYTKKANQMAVAFDMTTQESGEFLAKTKAQLNLGTDELFKYMDTVNYLSDNTASKAKEIAEISQRVASLGDMAGVSREGVAAFGATLVSIGKTPEVAATGLKALYTDLMAGKSATASQTRAFKQLGLEAETVAKNMVQDGEGTILAVLSRIKELPKHLQASTIKDIFGTQAIDSVTGMVNQLDLLKENLDKSKSAMANGAVENEYKNRMKTLGTQLKVVKNQTMNTLADLGLALAPTIKNLAEQMTPVIKNIANWVKENPKLVEGIMKAVGIVALFSAGIATAVKVGVPLFKFFNFLHTGFSKIGVIFSIGSKIGNVFKLISSGVVKGVLGIGKAFMGVIKFVKMIGVAIKAAFVANPVGMIIIAIIAVIAILVVLYHKSKTFRDFVNKMWATIKYAAISAWIWIKNTAMDVFDVMKIFVTAFVRSVIADFKFFVALVKGIWKMISSSFKAAIEVWKGIFKLFIAFFTGKWDEIPGIVKGIWEAIKSGMSGFVDGAKQILSGLFDWFSDKWNALKGAASDMLNLGKNKVKKEQQQNINHYQLGMNYAGTNYWKGGLTTVAERGAELIKIPGQNPFLAQSEMLLNLPKGTQILNNAQTRSTLRDKVSNLKNRVSEIKNRGNTSFGGDNITIQIIGGNNSPVDIAKEVNRILRERDNRKRRVSFG